MPGEWDPLTKDVTSEMERSTVWEKRYGIAQSRESRFQVTVIRPKTDSAMKRIRLSSYGAISWLKSLD